MTPTHTNRVEVPSKIPHTSYDDKLYITKRTIMNQTRNGELLQVLTVYQSATFLISQPIKSTIKQYYWQLIATLDSIPILMKLPVMVNKSLTMRRIYQPLMNSILSPKLTLRPSLCLKNCTYSWMGGKKADIKDDAVLRYFQICSKGKSKVIILFVLDHRQKHSCPWFSNNLLMFSSW